MAQREFTEESTPAFGESPVAQSDNDVAKSALQSDENESWEEEKTILVFDDEDGDATCSLVEMDTGDIVSIDQYPFSIGRNRHANLQVKHRSVSRQHAVLDRDNDGLDFVIRDLGSSNGVKINGVKVQSFTLNDGDIIKIGDVEYRFQHHRQSGRTDAAIDLNIHELDRPSLMDRIVGRFGVSRNDASNARRSSAPTSFSLSQKALSLKEKYFGAHASDQNDDEIDFGATRVVEGSPLEQDIAQFFKRRKYAVIAGVAGMVLLIAYMLSPSRRVEIIDAPQMPVAAVSDQQGSATGEAESAERSQATKTDNSTSQKMASTHTTTHGETSDQIGRDNEFGRDTEATGIEQRITDGETSIDAASIQVASERSNSGRSSEADGNIVITSDVNQDSVTKSNVDGITVATTKDVTVANGDDNSVQATASVKNASPPAKVIRRSPAWSRNYIINSKQMYIDGDVEKAVSRLRILSRSSRHQRQFRDESRALADSIERAYQDYLEGRNLLDQGRDDEAFLKWRDFLLGEETIFPGQESIYAQNIKSEVAALYTGRGNAAYAEGRFHDAYTAWQRASSIAPNQEAAQSLLRLQQRAKDRFIEGYLQENINLQAATNIWNEVLILVPPGNEYHIKAKSKISLYKNFTTAR